MGAYPYTYHLCAIRKVPEYLLHGDTINCGCGYHVDPPECSTDSTQAMDFKQKAVQFLFESMNSKV